MRIRNEASFIIVDDNQPKSVKDRLIKLSEYLGDGELTQLRNRVSNNHAHNGRLHYWEVISSARENQERARIKSYLRRGIK